MWNRDELEFVGGRIQSGVLEWHRGWRARPRVPAEGGAWASRVSGRQMDWRREHQVCPIHGLPLCHLCLQGTSQVSPRPWRSTRIFKSLSSFLGTRTPRQCRSHFQKIMNKFKKLNKVKQHYQQLLGAFNYSERLEELNQRLRETPIREDRDSEKVHADLAIQTDPLQLRL